MVVMSKKQSTQAFRHQAPEDRLEGPPIAPMESLPARKGRPPQKPRLVVKTGREAHAVHREEEEQPLTFWGWMIRLLPVWALVIMILFLEPTLPIRAVGALVDWVRSLGPEPTPPPVVEPIFIVEGPQGTLQDDLPPPNWSLNISPAFTPEVQYWAADIARWSVTYRIKPNLIATLMQIESCGNPNAASEAGAMGLFQVLALHFEEGEDPFDPDTNARRGLQYFIEMYALANGDLGLTFAAYNGGPAIFEQSPAEWPSETQAYQYWGSGIFEETERGFVESPTLLDWLAAGGESLCAEAAEALGISRE